MINLEFKNCKMILTEKQQKYQHYHLEKLINMNILYLIDKYEEILPSNQRQTIEQAKFTYCSLGIAFAKKIEKQGKNNRYYYKSKRKTSGFNQGR